MLLQDKSLRRTAMRFLLAFCFITAVYYTISSFANYAPLPQPPYFSETNFEFHTHTMGAVSHSDSRFAVQLDEDALRTTLVALVNSLNDFAQIHNITLWLAHGALLGWYWNAALLPWDTDVDVQTTFEDIQTLAQYHNQTSHEDLTRSATTTYLLDVNPQYSDVSQQDVANKIDARWINTSNGKFVDITAVHDTPDNISLRCKDGHHYVVGLPKPASNGAYT